MARLNNPHRTDLSRKDLEEFPVWVWDDANEGYLPLSKSEPINSEYGTMFIKATFKTNRHTFDGYLIGINSYYAFAIFIGEEQIIFNFNLTEFFKEDLEKVFNYLKCKPFNFFPIQYKSDVCMDDKKEISGILSPNGKIE